MPNYHHNITIGLFLYLCLTFLLSVECLRIKPDEWNQVHLLANGYSPRQCQPIPENMTLCQSVGYREMVLPNHFQQDTMRDAVLQSNAWMPLISVKCHPELTRFLCSLYAPVCLKGHQELKIMPCKSLCTTVKDACLPLMQKYGFSWPQRLACDSFPTSSEGLCIPLQESTSSASTSSPQSLSSSSSASSLSSSSSSSSSSIFSPFSSSNQQKNGMGNNKKGDKKLPMMADGENQECSMCKRGSVDKDQIWKVFCETDVVIKAKIKRVEISDGNFKIHLGNKNARNFKLKEKWNGRFMNSCPCNWLRSGSVTSFNWLLMGKKENDGSVTVMHILPWNRQDQEFKKAIRKIRRRGAEMCNSNSQQQQQQNLMKKVSIRNYQHELSTEQHDDSSILTNDNNNNMNLKNDISSSNNYFNSRPLAMKQKRRKKREERLKALQQQNVDDKSDQQQQQQQQRQRKQKKKKRKKEAKFRWKQQQQ